MNKQVNIGDSLLILENKELQKQIEDLQREKEKYEILLRSTTMGNLLELEKMKLKKEILQQEQNLQQLKLEQQNTSTQLSIFTGQFQIAKKEYDIYNNLLVENSISISEFEEVSTKFMEISSKYNSLKSDSLIISKEIENTNTFLTNLDEQSNILLNDASVLSPQYSLKLEEINSKMNKFLREMNNMTIVSPVNGTITDLMVEIGESVNSGETVMETSNLKDIWVVAYGNSVSQKQIHPMMKVLLNSNLKKTLYGKVISISPVMKKIKSLSAMGETENTYIEIEIQFNDINMAKQYFTPGERLFVNILLN